MDNGAEYYEAYAGGDDSAMYDLVREYRDGMIMFIRGTVGDVHRAEEICEDVFFDLAVKKPKYAQKYSFRTWLYTLCRNKTVDYIRREAGRATLSADEIAESVADGEVLEREYLKSEQRIALYRALGELSEDHRTVLMLSAIEGLPNAETAAVMGKTKRQVENLLYRAKSALRIELEKEGFVYEEL